jgi:uncharacterized protein (TIGR02466 family)
MSYKIEALFPTPIYVTVLDNAEEVNAEIRSKYDAFVFNGSRETWGKSTTVTDLRGNVLEKYGMPILKDTINHHINNYVKELGWDLSLTPDDYDMESWMTVNPPQTHTHVHDHGYHEITGVYYYETNRKDGNIFFISPTGGMNGNYFLQNCAGRWDHVPKVGKLILFPGYLEHGVKSNDTDHTRKAFAFSITLHRDKVNAKIRSRKSGGAK